MPLRVHSRAVDCPSDEIIAALVEGALPDEDAAAIHGHADGCASCRRLIATVAKRESDDDETVRERGEDPGAERESPLAAAHIGRYQILKHLATGGMGSVYAAYD